MLCLRLPVTLLCQSVSVICLSMAVQVSSNEATWRLSPGGGWLPGWLAEPLCRADM
jgi:hypothetical protein